MHFVKIHAPFFFVLPTLTAPPPSPPHPYPPCQSGGQYDLKVSASSSDEPLCYESMGAILCSIGARYSSYCSNISRTYLIDATPAQETAYKVGSAY